LARHGSFKSDKRRKELLRLQKQEEKRQRRFGGKTDKEPDTDEPGTLELTVEESSPEETVKDAE